MRVLVVGAAVTVGVLAAGVALAQQPPVVIGAAQVAQFNQIPEDTLTAAAQLSAVFVNRSVGAILSQYLDCLAFPTDEQAPTRCKRWRGEIPAFDSPQSEVDWNRPGGYPRGAFQYFAFPGQGITPVLPCGMTNAGQWFQAMDCFIRWMDTDPNVSVVVPMLSYLEVQATSDITSPTRGLFVPNQPTRIDIADLEAAQARHPDHVMVWTTTSLARGIGTQVAETYNNQVRAYVAEHGGILFDVADVERHDPWGQECVDNRDGVPYVRPNGQQENYPDDGLALAAICQHYTSEVDGGHLGAPSAGGIRLAKAWWVLMAYLTGWRP